MKRVILGLVAIFFALTTFAQTPQQLLEAAKKATKGDVKKEKVAEVDKIVEDALKAPENQSGAEAYLYKTKLQLSMAKLDEATQALTKITGKPAKNEYISSGLKAADAIMMALKNNKDPKLGKEILKTMVDVAPLLSGPYAQDMMDAKDYVGAYTSFKTALDLHKALKGAGQKGSLDKPEDYNRQLYLAGLLSGYAGKEKEAQPIYEEMMAGKQDSLFVYSAMFKLKKDAGDKEGAMKILEQGRKRYPEETSLLFAEINHYLEAGKMDVLIDKLKEGIQKEPKNVSLYFTLGNVYDNLSQKEPAKAEEYAKESLIWYNKTLEIDPKHADATYSIGASYYNKAAKFSQDMKKLESDFSKAGQKKYEEAEKLMLAEFEKALPYFQKAESFDSNNQNALIALKEIFARKGDLNMSKEFKARLETVQGGGKNEKSYFKF
jgi:tetratricopeptide (TPR) repeat protein